MRGRKAVIDAGCGSRKMPGAVGVDIVATDGVDVVGDIERGLPFRTSSIDVAHAYHVLEHVADFTGAMEELWRVLRPGGRAYVNVPHAASPYMTWKDPTHRRGLSLATFTYFDESYFDGRAFGYYSRARFRIERATLRFTAQGAPVAMTDPRELGLPPPEPRGVTVARRVANPLFHALANRGRAWQYACERFWGPIVGIEEVDLVLRAVK